MSKLKSAAQKLLEIGSHSPDQAVASAIAEALLESDRQPYCFAINHDIRPPKCLACPLDYDWSLKDHVGIETVSLPYARKWIVAAVLKGYTVSMAGVSGHNMPSPRHQPYGTTMSIPWARKRAQWHQSDLDRKAKGGLDDDIPF